MLTVEHLRKQFPIAGSRKVVSAINDVSFSIAPGETLGLVGESGSGKSTVGRIVVGLIEPTSGAVRFNLAGDAQGKARPPNGKVQLVFQEPAESLDPRMKIGSTIAEPLQARTTCSGWAGPRTAPWRRVAKSDERAEAHRNERCLHRSPPKSERLSFTASNVRSLAKPDELPMNAAPSR